MREAMDLSTSIRGVHFPNPFWVASGVLDCTQAIIERMGGDGAGAIVTKTIGPIPRPGYSGPTVISPARGTVINAMGLPNPGMDVFLEDFRPRTSGGSCVIPSIYGGNAEEYALGASRAESAGAEMVELNISCPHSSPDLLTATGKKFLVGESEEATREVVSRVADSISIPFLTKLTPNATDIGAIARAAIDAGSTGITAVNTFPAFYVDTTLATPVLGNSFGGQSGSSVFPQALRKMLEVRLALQEDADEHGSRIPLIGVGGISTGDHAIQAFMCGCEAVQIGSAILDDPRVFRHMKEETELILTGNGHTSLSDIQDSWRGWF